MKVFVLQWIEIEQKIVYSLPIFIKGVQVGDEVLHFGSVNTDNFSGLAAIGEIVLHANGVC